MPIFSLGMACRPAQQIKKNLETDFISGPFDWTVSSAKSIFRFFERDFKVEDCLTSANIRFFGNGLQLKCDYSDLIFHHGLGPKELKKIRPEGNEKYLRYSPTPSSSLLKHDDYIKTKGRFLFTAKRLISICEFCESKIIFIRWIGCGLNNPDSKIPHAGHADPDDNAISMSLAIKTRFPSIDMHFIQVQTIYTDKHDEGSRIAFIDKVKRDVTIIYLKEDFPKGFTGDDESWTQLSKYISDTIV